MGKEEGARRGPHSSPLGTARPWCRVPRMAWVPHVAQVGALSGQSTFGTLSRQSTFEHFRGMFGQSDDELVTRGRLGPWPTKYARGHWHAVHRGTCTRRILDLPQMERAGYSYPSSHGARSTVRISGVRVPSGRTAHGPSSKVPQTHAPRCTVHRADAACAEMERAAWTLRGGGFGNLKKKGAPT